ncbi:MAG: hypothetical protein ACK5X0_08475 [Rhodospirillales bacterium]|jgi:hypothetical protein
MSAFAKKPSRLGAPPVPAETLNVTAQPEHAPAPVAVAQLVAPLRPIETVKDLNFKVGEGFFWRFSDFANSRRMKKADLLRAAFALAERHPDELAQIFAEQKPR